MIIKYDAQGTLLVEEGGGNTWVVDFVHGVEVFNKYQVAFQGIKNISQAKFLSFYCSKEKKFKLLYLRNKFQTSPLP